MNVLNWSNFFSVFQRLRQSNAGSIKDNYAVVYQIKRTESNRSCRYKSIDLLHKQGLTVDPKRYYRVYTRKLTPIQIKNSDVPVLNDLYYIFNCDIPKDFRGTSMSISDIVVLYKDGKVASYYVDDIGFTKLADCDIFETDTDGNQNSQRE